MRTMDCEIVVTFQGYPDTKDEDSDDDGDTVRIGTEKATATAKDAIQLLMAEAATVRKLEAAQQKLRTVKLWLPRNGVYSDYRCKETVAGKLRIHQVDGYDQKQIFGYVTASGMAPTLQTEEDFQEGFTHPKTPEDPNLRDSLHLQQRYPFSSS